MNKSGNIPPPLRSGGFWSLLFSSLLGRQKDKGRVGRLACSRPLTGSYSTGQEEILISVIFLCRSVHFSCVDGSVHLSLSKDSLYKTKVKANWGERYLVERKCPSLNLTNLTNCLKKFGSIFLSQLIWWVTSQVNPNQPKSTQRDIVRFRFCSWEEIKLSGLAPLRAANS